MTQKQDESKKRILEAAKICFAAEGFKGTSIRKICERAEANLALVSYYFGSKEKLYLSVIEYLYEGTEQNLGYLQNDSNPKLALHRFVDIFLHMRLQDKQFHMLLKHELSIDNSRSEAVSKFIKPYFERLGTILIDGKNQSVFHYESLDLIMTFIASILIYPVYDTVLLNSNVFEPYEIQKEITETAQFILAGLRCQP